MSKFLQMFLGMPNETVVQVTWALLRVAIGIITLLHGVPKFTGGFATWEQLGTFVLPLGINFLLPMWGFLGACTEFFGGMFLILGFGTRFVSFCLVLMMIVAYVWHVSRGDSFNLSSFPLSLIFLFAAFMIIGGGQYSLDHFLLNWKN